MIDTLNFGKYVFQALTSNSGITDIIHTQVYPIVKDNKVKNPFIVYRRLSMYSNDNKDIIHEDTVQVEIHIITDTYEQGITLANLVRQTLEVPYVEYDNMEITDARIVQATEDYNNAYIQALQFTFNVNEK